MIIDIDPRCGCGTRAEGKLACRGKPGMDRSPLRSDDYEQIISSSALDIQNDNLASSISVCVNSGRR